MKKENSGLRFIDYPDLNVEFNTVPSMRASLDPIIEDKRYVEMFSRPISDRVGAQTVEAHVAITYLDGSLRNTVKTIRGGGNGVYEQAHQELAPDIIAAVVKRAEIVDGNSDSAAEAEARYVELQETLLSMWGVLVSERFVDPTRRRPKPKPKKRSTVSLKDYGVTLPSSQAQSRMIAERRNEEEAMINEKIATGEIIIEEERRGKQTAPGTKPRRKKGQGKPKSKPSPNNHSMNSGGQNKDRFKHSPRPAKHNQSGPKPNKPKGRTKS
jgi:hypothetical protein